MEFEACCKLVASFLDSDTDLWKSAQHLRMNVTYGLKDADLLYKRCLEELSKQGHEKAQIALERRLRARGN